MILLLILLSFTASIWVSLKVLNSSNRKWVAMCSALMVNSIILTLATVLLYFTDQEAKMFGFGHTNLFLLILAIPIISWINCLIIEIKKMPA